MQNRRKFLKNTLLAASGAGLVSKAYSNPQNGPEKITHKNKIEYRTLGRTGINIPIISMGTGNTSNPNLVKEAYTQGVKLFATSEYYQNGNNEKMLGEALKDYPRDSFYILTGTNGGLDLDYENGLYKEGTDTGVFLDHANGCLERLQVDYVDFFGLGFAARREGVLYKPLLKAMEKFKSQGKAKFLSIGTHKFEPEAIRAAADAGIYDAVVTAYNFRKENTAEIDDAIDYATEKGLGIIAMKTMAGVYWDQEKTEAINTRAALKWVLQNKNIHTTVPDCSSFDQLHQDIEIMSDLSLTEEEKQDLKHVPGKLASGIYCQQCNQCIKQCRAKIDIPTIMRSYMYAYGHRNLAHAQNTLNSSGLSEFPCSKCNDCTVNCKMGFDIRTKILDIARIKDIPEDFTRHV